MIENFYKLEFNRKVDVLVAYHVMGWRNIIIELVEWNHLGESGKYWLCYIPSGTHVPCYSTLLTSAWDIVRKFDYLYLYHSDFINDGKWECKFKKSTFPACFVLGACCQSRCISATRNQNSGCSLSIRTLNGSRLSRGFCRRKIL